MYEFFQIVDEMHDDATLFPVLSAPNERLPFESEAMDGPDPIVFGTKAISVDQYTGNGWTQLRGYKDLKFTLVVTDARLVVYCEKWTKGGGWFGLGVGGLAVALAANAVSHARAARRRKGKLLVAQVRYPWLTQVVVVSDKRGRPSAVRLIVDAGIRGERRPLGLSIHPGRNDAAQLAADIATRAARARVTSGQPMAERELTALNQLARSAGSLPLNGMWSLPSAICVGAAGSLSSGNAAMVPALPVPRPALPAAPMPATSAPSPAAEVRPELIPPLAPSARVTAAPLPRSTKPAPTAVSASVVRHAETAAQPTLCPACGHPPRSGMPTCSRCGLSFARPLTAPLAAEGGIS